MAGHQLKKLAQSRGKGLRSSLSDVVPKHWSVYTLLFSTVFLLLFCFLLFDIRTSPTALLLHATNQLGALRAQAGEMYFQSNGNSPIDLSESQNFRKGMHHRAEDFDGDEDDKDDNQKRKPKSLEKGTEESSDQTSEENVLSPEFVVLEGSYSDSQELSADSTEDDTDDKSTEKEVKDAEKENNRATAEIQDPVIEEPLAYEEGIPEALAYEKESTAVAEKTDAVQEEKAEPNEGEETTEESVVVEEKVETKKDAVKKSKGTTKASEKDDKITTDEQGVFLSVMDNSDESQSSFVAETAPGSVEIKGKTTNLEKRYTDKKEADVESLGTEEVSVSKKDNPKKGAKKPDKESKPSKRSKTPAGTSGQEILKEVTTDGKCDYSVGQWVYDESYPLYKPDTCPFVDGGFRCVENGRPSDEFQKYRWQPSGCNLPRFDPKNMLERLRGLRLAFVGDSIGRNNWESLLCMLSDAVSNKSRIYEVNGESISKHKGFLSFRFEDYNCTVEYYRSPYLVPQGRAPPMSPPEVHSTFKLDQIDWSANQWKAADILIFNSGHWWSFEKTIRGGNYFQVKDKVKLDMEVGEAFRMAVTTVAKYIEENIDPQKTQVFWRSYAPVHFRGGTWKTGGSCIDEQRPLSNLPIYIEPWVNHMVLEETQRNTRAPINFLNVTFSSEHRADGHSSVWQRVPPSPVNRQDCSHWCLPGVPDTWNEFLYATLLDRRQGPWGDKTE